MIEKPAKPFALHEERYEAALVVRTALTSAIGKVLEQADAQKVIEDLLVAHGFITALENPDALPEGFPTEPQIAFARKHNVAGVANFFCRLAATVEKR